jgi:hypothetical protein
MKSSNIMKIITAFYFKCSDFMTMTMMIIFHNWHIILEWLYEKLQKFNDVQKNELLLPEEMKPRCTCPKQTAEYLAQQPHQPLASPSRLAGYYTMHKTHSELHLSFPVVCLKKN